MVSRYGWLRQSSAKQRLKLCLLSACLLLRQLLVVILLVVLNCLLLWQIPVVKGWTMVQMLKRQAREPAELPPSASLTPEEAILLRTNASLLQSASELFRSTNIWDVQLRFSAKQWSALGPNVIPPVVPFIQSDSSVILRNPRAIRNGLAGVLGIDLPWSEATLQFGDEEFQTVGARFKGNGTFVNSQKSYKRPFKIDLNRLVKSQKLAGRKTLNLHNLTADASYLSDTLAYEFFREAGVPAARTAFARLRLTVEGRFTDGLLGLYVMVENPDAEWARDWFGIPGVALFKPVTYELFKDLGDDWKLYEKIYDPKTKIALKGQRRIIELARLVTHAPDAEFAARIGDFMDLDEFASFLACEAILSNYDGILSNGQNFLLYLDPRTNRIGFIPWDLDHCWGEFPLVGSVQEREQASLRHPWVGEDRFLDRMLKTEVVRERYDRELRRISTTLFLPERLSRRMDELAEVVRPFIAEESKRRLASFERAVASAESNAGEHVRGPKSAPATFSHKRFFENRALALSRQLEGKADGVILTRKPLR